MIEYSSNFLFDSDPGLIDRFEDMLKRQASYFFDVEEIEVLAEYYLDRGKAKKAHKAVRHGLGLHPKSPALLLKEAQTLLMIKQPQKALLILDFLEAAEPTNTEMLLFKAVVHRNLSDHEGTKSCLLKALDSTPENKEDIFLDLAFEQEMVEDYHGAIQSLKQSLEINPDHEASLFELGYCFDMADELKSGVAYFHEYLDENPYSFVGWYNIAMCYEKMAEFKKAIDCIDYCLAIRENFTNAHILRGNMYTSSDDDMTAIECYAESLIHDAENPMVYAAIGECYERLEEWELAEANYKHALGIDANYVDAIMGLGAIKEHEQNFTACLAHYREALDIDELNLDNWHIYAETLKNTDRLLEAEKAYKHMSCIFGDDEESWTQLAEIRALNTGHAEAIATLEEALTIVSDSQDIYWHMAKHLVLSGKARRGQELLADALSNNPEGSKYFIDIFPESTQMPNIAALIELYTKEKSADEL